MGRSSRIVLQSTSSNWDSILSLDQKGMPIDYHNSDLIFSVPKLISFLSQSTKLPAGTVIITGTPAGVGISQQPKVTIQDGDEFTVEITPYIGSLINKFENEK